MWRTCELTGSDTGVKAILKEIHDKIKALETDLTDSHRKMSADPEAGISILFDPSSSSRSGREARKDSGDLTPEEASAWLDLISKHKQYVPILYITNGRGLCSSAQSRLTKKAGRSPSRLPHSRFRPTCSHLSSPTHHPVQYPVANVADRLSPHP